MTGTTASLEGKTEQEKTGENRNEMTTTEITAKYMKKGSDEDDNHSRNKNKKEGTERRNVTTVKELQFGVKEKKVIKHEKL